MRDYKKMMEEGWINQTVIEQEMAQERRAAKEDYAKAIADVNAQAEKKCEEAKAKYMEQLKCINEAKEAAKKPLQDALNAKLMELSVEQDTLRRCLYEMGIFHRQGKAADTEAA